MCGDIIWLTALNTIVPFLLGMTICRPWVTAGCPTHHRNFRGPAAVQCRLIDVRLFTALVAAASFTAIIVPLGFALLIRRWGEQLTTPQSDI